MKIQTKTSLTGNLQTNYFCSDHLHQSYDFETNKTGKVILFHSFIERFKDKTFTSKEEIQLAWNLVKLLKECVLDFDRAHNFTLHIKDGQIKLTVGGDCAFIKNNYQEYEDYLNRLELLGIESYIEFQIELEGNKSKIKNGEFGSSIGQKINDIALDAYYKRLHETELDLLINLLTKVKNKEVKDASELTNSICQIVKTIYG